MNTQESKEYEITIKRVASKRVKDITLQLWKNIKCNIEKYPVIDITSLKIDSLKDLCFKYNYITPLELRIIESNHWCPLCTYFNEYDIPDRVCPINTEKNANYCDCGYYYSISNKNTKEENIAIVDKMIELIEKWEVE